MDYETMGHGGHVQNPNIPAIPEDDEVQDADDAGAVVEHDGPPPLTHEKLLGARLLTRSLTTRDGQQIYAAMTEKEGALREEFATTAAKLGGQIADGDAAAQNKFRVLDSKLQKLGPLLDGEFAKRDKSLAADEAAIKAIDAKVEGNRVHVAALGDNLEQHRVCITDHAEHLKAQGDQLNQHGEWLTHFKDWKTKVVEPALAEHAGALKDHTEELSGLSARIERAGRAAADIVNLAYGADVTANEALAGVQALQKDARAQQALDGLTEMKKNVHVFITGMEEVVKEQSARITAAERNSAEAKVMASRPGGIRLFLADLAEKAQDLVDGIRRVAGKASLGLAGATAAIVLVYTVSAFAMGSSKAQEAPEKTAAAASNPAEKTYGCKELPFPPYRGDIQKYAGWIQLDCGFGKVVLGDPSAKPATGDRWPAKLAGKDALMKSKTDIPTS